MDENIKKKALDGIDNMRNIVVTEGLIHDYYLNPNLDEKRNAVCSGPKYCLIGSMWAGCGLEPDNNRCYQSYRSKDLEDNPALKLVYDTMNSIAEDRFKNNPNLKNQIWDSAAESYFENNNPGRNHLVSMIDRARKKIEEM